MPGLQSDEQTVIKYKKYDKGQNPASGKKIRPSELSRSAKAPTEDWRKVPRIVERHDLKDASFQTGSAVGPDEPLFQPFPSRVFFSGYKPSQTYSCALSFRNNDMVARRMRVVPPESPCLTVAKAKGGGDEGGKVASGMEVSYTVTFAPDADSRQEYKGEILVCTERETFAVPVICQGTSAKLDFPDEIVFKPTPAKASTPQIFLVTNGGDRSANLVLLCSPPFSISPSSALLQPGGMLQCTVLFSPASEGLHEGELEVQQEGGPLTTTGLRGHGCELDVSVVPSVAAFLPTYLHQHCQFSFRMSNKSNRPVNFKWRQNETPDVDFAHATARLTAASLHRPAADIRTPESVSDCSSDGEEGRGALC
eukprot:jgi/Botrbrau1/17802/Bobra.0127s0051.1